MPKENNVIEATGFFGGSSMKGTYDVDLTVKFPEYQLTNAIQFLAGIGKDIKIIAQVNEIKLKLGTFKIYSLNIDRDANTKIRFKSMIDHCDVNSISQLMIDEETPIVLKAKIVETE